MRELFHLSIVSSIARPGLFASLPGPMMSLYGRFLVRIEVPVRFVGFAFLAAGFLLCLSIAWAAVGFFAMACGLMLLLIAEDQRKSANDLGLTNLDSILPTVPQTPMEIVNRRNELALEHDQVPYEENNWESLVAGDEELSQAVNLLLPLGREYVDQLARVYLTFKIKAYLPTILKMILEAAQADAGLLDLDDPGARNLPRNPIGKQLSNFEKTPENDANDKAVAEAHNPIEEVACAPHDAVCAPVPPLSKDGIDDNLRDLLTRLDLTSGNRR